jgi:SAM-dependent methyltransferase
MIPRLTSARGRQLRRRLRRVTYPAWIRTLYGAAPLSAVWGADRGAPIDRFYIERFIAVHRHAIRGRVLEIKDSRYATRYGAEVTRCDILDVSASNPRATIVANLECATAIPSNTFDCCIVTQTLQYVYDLRAAAAELHRILRPGGVLLATLPGIAPRDSDAPYPVHWRFTGDACVRLFGDEFGHERTAVETHGNLPVTIGFLAGMAQEDLSLDELQLHDPNFPLVVAVRAVKRGDA